MSANFHPLVYIIDYILGIIMWTLVGRVAMNWIVIGVGALQVISPLTKFCPVYFILNKMMPDSDPIQNGN